MRGVGVGSAIQVIPILCLFSDIKLAVQVGLLLLRNNKELEMVLEATEKQYEEQKLRADVRLYRIFNFKSSSSEHVMVQVNDPPINTLLSNKGTFWFLS